MRKKNHDADFDTASEIDIDGTDEDLEGGELFFQRLKGDLREAAGMLSIELVQFLVNYYYQVQKDRIRLQAQVKKKTESTEPNAFLMALFKNMRTFEFDIKGAMSEHNRRHTETIWLESIVGIGPVIAAGLYSQLDATDHPYFGQFQRYAGLDPTLKWLGKEKATKIVKSVVKEGGMIDREQLASIAAAAGRKLQWFEEKFGDQKWTTATAAKILAKPPYNTDLKTLRWKLGESLVKTCNKKESQYGKFYLQKRILDWQKNLNGNLVGQAQEKLREFNIDTKTEAYRWYAGGYDPRDYKGPIPPIEKTKDAEGKLKVKILLPTVETGKGIQMLPPAHINSRAARYATKMLLSHYHEVAYFAKYKIIPPAPWIIEHGGHKDYFAVPNTHLVPGYDEAFKERKKYFNSIGVRVINIS